MSNKKGLTVEGRVRVEEFAKRVGVSPRTVWAWVGARKIDVYRVGKIVSIPETEIARMLNEDFRPHI